MGWQNWHGYGIIIVSKTKAPRYGGEGKCPARCVGPPGQVAILQHGMAAWSRAAFWVVTFPCKNNCAEVGLFNGGLDDNVLVYSIVGPLDVKQFGVGAEED